MIKMIDHTHRAKSFVRTKFGMNLGDIKPLSQEMPSNTADKSRERSSDARNNKFIPCKW